MHLYIREYIVLMIDDIYRLPGLLTWHCDQQLTKSTLMVMSSVRMEFFSSAIMKERNGQESDAADYF